MTIYNDAVPVTSTEIVTLAYVKANSKIVASDAIIQALIDAATSWILGEKRWVIYKLAGPYPVSIQMAISKICQAMYNLTNANNTIKSESLGDYSYSQGDVRNLIDPEITLLLSPWIKRSAPVTGE